jgi:hypothetical protein
MMMTLNIHWISFTQRRVSAKALWAYDDYSTGIEEDLFWLWRCEKETRCLALALMISICDLFAEFIQRTYADDAWMPSDPGPDLVEDVLFSSLLIHGMLDSKKMHIACRQETKKFILKTLNSESASGI